MVNIYNKKYDPLILDLFNNSKLSARNISQELNINIASVYKVLRDNKIDPMVNGRHRPHDPEKELEVVKLYYERVPINKIRFITKVRAKDIPEVLKRHQVKLFNRRKTYVLDEGFFENIDTPIKAILFGVFYSDGSICEERCRVSLTLAIQDKDLVEFVKKELKTDHKIFIKKHSGECFGYECQDIALLNLQSKRMMLDLKRHGCIECKSLTKEFPHHLDKSLIQSFTYGYFLGNGSIYNRITKTGHTDFTISISSNRNMCEAFKLIFKEELDIHCSLRGKKGKHPSCCELTIGGNQQVRKFVEWMMKDMPRAMERKNLLIDEFLEFMKNW